MGFLKQNMLWIGALVVILALSVFGVAMMGSIAGAKPKSPRCIGRLGSAGGVTERRTPCCWRYDEGDAAGQLTAHSVEDREFGSGGTGRA